MKLAFRFVALIVFTALVSGCDTPQPTRMSPQAVTLTFSAVNARSSQFFMWDVFEDNDGDHKPDDGTVTQYCERGMGSAFIGSVTSIPWNFSLQIEILRVDATEPVQLTSEKARAVSELNVALYDETTGITFPFEQEMFVGARRFRFVNMQRVPAARRDVMMATANSYSAAVGGSLGDGICSVGYPGPELIDGLEQPWILPDPASQDANMHLALQRGDTLIVQARLADAAPNQSPLIPILVSNPTHLSATFLIDGRSVEVEGSTAGEVVNFRYTSR